MKRDFWGTAQNVAKLRRAVVRTAERASCRALRQDTQHGRLCCSRSVFKQPCLLESLTQPVPIERRETQKRHALCGRRRTASQIRPVRKHPAPHTSLARRGAARRERTGASGGGTRRQASPITRCSRLRIPRCTKFESLHFTTIDQRSAANMSDPRTDHGQKLGNGSARSVVPITPRFAPPSPPRAAALDNETPAAPARADQATDARAVLLRRPLVPCDRTLRPPRGPRRASARNRSGPRGPGRQRVERTPELEDRGERYRRDIAPARHLTGR